MENIIDLYIGKENVKTIIEAGACDCEDSVKLTKQYPNAHVYAFECNPETIPLCKNKKGDNLYITLTEKALGEFDGSLIFYPIDTKKTRTTHENGNPGASSVFKANPEYPSETYVQNMITVPCIRLDGFLKDKDIKEIDLLWLDAQGAELSILKGLGDRIKDVKVIKTEVLFKPQYEGAPLADDVFDYLEDRGFRFGGYETKYEWFGDALFVNENLK